MVFGTVGEAAIDQAHQSDVGTQAEGFVGGTEDVLMDDIFNALLLQP